MPGPWKLLSPNGLLYNVADQDALLRLATVEGLNPSNMSVLVNESTGNLTEGAEKSHEKQWVRLQCVKWLRRDGCAELVYTLGIRTRDSASRHPRRQVQTHAAARSW